MNDRFYYTIKLEWGLSKRCEEVGCTSDHSCFDFVVVQAASEDAKLGVRVLFCICVTQRHIA